MAGIILPIPIAAWVDHSGKYFPAPAITKVIITHHHPCPVHLRHP